jgi:hypothetical protein
MEKYFYSAELRWSVYDDDGVEWTAPFWRTNLHETKKECLNEMLTASFSDVADEIERITGSDYNVNSGEEEHLRSWISEHDSVYKSDTILDDGLTLSFVEHLFNSTTG